LLICYFYLIGTPSASTATPDVVVVSVSPKASFTNPIKENVLGGSDLSNVKKNLWSAFHLLGNVFFLS